MNTFEYIIIKMEPVFTDADTIESILNEKGSEGYRFVSVQKFWTTNHEGESIQRNYLVLEKSFEDEL